MMLFEIVRMSFKRFQYVRWKITSSLPEVRKGCYCSDYTGFGRYYMTSI